MSDSVCRVCLVGDVRMLRIEDVQLLEIYEKLTSAKLDTDDGRPTTICYICCSQLQRSRVFSDMAQRSEKFLNDLLQNNMEVKSATVATLKTGLMQTLTINILENTSFNGALDNNSIETSVKEEMASDDDYTMNKTEAFTEHLEFSEIKTEASTNTDIYYSCDECQIKYTTKKELITHLKVHNSGKYCKSCNKTFSSSAGLRAHRSIHTDERPFPCHICGRAFRKKSYLTNHLRIHEEKPYHCNMCGTAFAEVESYDRHMLTHTRERKYGCPKCHLRFPFKSHYNRHMQVHTGEKPVACNLCSKKFFDHSSLTKHMMTHTGIKPFPCPICKTAFTHAGNLKRHMYIHADQKPFACDKCDKKYNDPSALNVHMKMHAGDKPKTSPENPKSPINDEKANHSEKTSLAPENDNETVKPVILGKTCNRNRPHCLVCKKKQYSNTGLIEHMRIHTGERPFTCDICSKTFRTKALLKGHSIVHTGVKCCSCEICGISFTQKSSLTKHMILHTGLSPYACHLCDKKYKQSGQLTSHIRNIHHKIKRFSCELCNAKFTSGSHLKKHMNAHAGLKPYTCVKCNNKFTTNSVLKRHLANTCK